MKSDEKEICELSACVNEQRRNLLDSSSLTEDELDEAVSLEQQYFEMLAGIVDDIREKEEGYAYDGRKFNKEEKAYLKKHEDELTKAIKEFNTLCKAGYLKDKTEEILELAETQYSKSEHKDNLSDAFEESRYRLDEYYNNLGYNLEEFESPMTEHDWTVFIKKPKKSQLQATLKALDEQQPQWTRKGEYFEMKALIATLLSGYPELVKKNAPLDFLEGEGAEPPQNSGCLSMIVASGLVLSFVGLKTFGVI